MGHSTTRGIPLDRNPSLRPGLDALSLWLAEQGYSTHAIGRILAHTAAAGDDKPAVTSLLHGLDGPTRCVREESFLFATTLRENLELGSAVAIDETALRRAIWAADPSRR